MTPFRYSRCEYAQASSDHDQPFAPIQVSAAQDFLRNTALSLAAVAALQMPAAVGPDQVQLRSRAMLLS